VTRYFDFKCVSLRLAEFTRRVDSNHIFFCDILSCIYHPVLLFHCYTVIALLTAEMFTFSFQIPVSEFAAVKFTFLCCMLRHYITGTLQSNVPLLPL
jgi:hypothetical protein